MPDYASRLGFPGYPPFTRGIYPTMYAGRPWTMRQYSGYATAEETNRRYRYLLDRGQTGLSVAFDLPTQMGYDSTAPESVGEVGKAGVAIDTLEDMVVLFRGIPLDKVSVSMTINATAPIVLAMYIVAAERGGVGPEKLSGTVQNDILKEFIARGCYLFPPKPSLRLTTDLIAYCLKHLPRWNSISISGYHIREAGSTAAQQLGFTLASAVAYVESAVRRGLPADAIGERISFFFNAHNDFFEEIAKFRAARRAWDRIMKERFGVRNERARLLRFHVQTAGSTLTAQQPENNVTRVTFQALAAVLGGAQSIHTNAMDEAIALPTEQSARVALRTQQIMAEETGIVGVIDPFGGSSLLEEWTDRLESEAFRFIEEIDRQGGAVAAIDKGYYQAEIEKSALQYQRDVESGQRIVVGVNRFREEAEGGSSPIRYLKIDQASQEEQKRRLIETMKRRDGPAVKGALDRLRRSAEGDENLMPSIVDAVRTTATVGEICGVLAGIFGRYRPR
ncbi:MAG: methylmalonyl-CoA mutase [Planctomycetes bacterium RBG_16_59_8]|nr:MAG: methylmalonyl-CoA mutase [Planctomycetes bacterium RBG_16_59_8]